MQRSATTGSLPYVDHEMYHRKVQRMQRNIDTQQSKVLDCRQKIEALKKQQGNVRNAKHTSNKLGTWRLLYDIQKRPEGILRAPDRKNPIRLYSRMDNDVWGMAELRGWFQQYSMPSTEGGMDALVTEYMRHGTHPAHVTKEIPPHLRFDSAQTSRDVSAGAVPTFPRTPSPHYMRESEHTERQRARSLAHHKSRLHYPPKAEGRIDGATRAPWKDRPAHEESVYYVPPEIVKLRDEYVAQGGGLENYHEQRAYTQHQKAMMHAGSAPLPGRVAPAEMHQSVYD